MHGVAGGVMVGEVFKEIFDGPGFFGSFGEAGVADCGKYSGGFEEVMGGMQTGEGCGFGCGDVMVCVWEVTQVEDDGREV